MSDLCSLDFESCLPDNVTEEDGVRGIACVLQTCNENHAK